MLTNRSAPPVTVTPVLIYPDVRAAVAWLESAFGFEERVRVGEAHRAQLRVGADGAVIVADSRGDQNPRAGEPPRTSSRCACKTSTWRSHVPATRAPAFSRSQRPMSTANARACSRTRLATAGSSPRLS